MASIKVLGDAMVVTSTLKTAQIQDLAKFRNTALTIRDKESKEPLYKVTMSENGGTASFDSNGVRFNGTNPNGFAIATLALPAGKTNEQKKAYISDIYGLSVLALNSAEKEIAKAHDGLDKDIKAANDAVKFVDETN